MSEPERHYFAICLGCDPVWPLPFGVAFDERNRWIEAHEQATGHMVMTTWAYP